ncbi:MAG: ABC transporter permease [Oscillospiraceae bacterium]|jgi:spermidine/putrescine transport system permease protein|nr:ABC transporter permease [Oscillospiraceae bacterium]
MKAARRGLIGAIGLFLYAPIFVLIVFSFNASKSQMVWGGFTLSWYGDLFRDNLVLSSLYTTLSIGVLASALSSVIGTAAAIGFHAMRRKPRGVCLQVNNIPVVNPDIITGVSFRLLFVVFLSLFAAIGLDLQLGFVSLLLAHMSFCIPYVILSVLPKLGQMGANVYEAALDLGAHPLAALRKAVLPEIMPGVVSGFIISFTLSIDDFMISYFTSGTAVQTLPVTIYSMTRKRISPEINALSTIMFLSVLLLLILVNVLQSKDTKKHKRT